MAVVTATSPPSYIYGRMLFCIFITHILPNIRFAGVTAACSALRHLQLSFDFNILRYSSLYSFNLGSYTCNFHWCFVFG